MSQLKYFTDFQLGQYLIIVLKSNSNISNIEGHFTGFGYTSNMFTDGEVDRSVIEQEGPEGIFVDDQPILFSTIEEIYGEIEEEI